MGQYSDPWRIQGNHGDVVYDLPQNAIVGSKASGFPDAINWVGMSMSGTCCIVGYEDTAIYTDIFSRDFTARTSLPEGAAGHGDAALTADSLPE